jgi:hypothetical protein
LNPERRNLLIKKWKYFYLAIFIYVMIALMGCFEADTPQKMEIGANPDLAAHSKEFKEDVIKVTEGVYVAVGSALPTL